MSNCWNSFVNGGTTIAKKILVKIPNPVKQTINAKALGIAIRDRNLPTRVQIAIAITIPANI